MARSPHDPSTDTPREPAPAAPRVAREGAAEDRLAAALKANLARRKAQGRARARTAGDDNDNKNE